MSYEPGNHRRELPATRQFMPPPATYQSPAMPAHHAAPLSYGPVQQPIMFTPVRKSSTAAVWSLVLGLVGFFAGWCLLGIPCLAAVIVGHVALSDTKDDAKTGRGMAVAGLSLGYVSLAPAIILFFWLIVGGVLGGAGATVSPTSTP